MRELQQARVEVMKIHLAFRPWLFRFAIFPSCKRTETDTERLSSISEN